MVVSVRLTGAVGVCVWPDDGLIDSLEGLTSSQVSRP